MSKKYLCVGKRVEKRGYRNNKQTQEPGRAISKVNIKRPSEQRCGVMIVLSLDGRPRQPTDRHF
jgi:hypothetical protein